MSEIFKYYGLDWLSIIFSIIAMILLGNKSRWGFVSFIFANFTWILLGSLLIHSYAIVIGNMIFLVTNTRGFIKWSNESGKKLPKSFKSDAEPKYNFQLIKKGI